MSASPQGRKSLDGDGLRRGKSESWKSQSDLVRTIVLLPAPPDSDGRSIKVRVIPLRGQAGRTPYASGDEAHTPTCGVYVLSIERHFVLKVNPRLSPSNLHPHYIDDWRRSSDLHQFPRLPVKRRELYVGRPLPFFSSNPFYPPDLVQVR